VIEPEIEVYFDKQCSSSGFEMVSTLTKFYLDLKMRAWSLLRVARVDIS